MLTVYIDRIGIDFSGSMSIFRLPPGNPLEATLPMTEEVEEAQVDRQFFFPTSRQRLPEYTRFCELGPTLGRRRVVRVRWAWYTIPIRVNMRD